MKDLEEVLNGLEQVEENWFSDDGSIQVCNVLEDASIRSSIFPSPNLNSPILKFLIN